MHQDYSKQEKMLDSSGIKHLFNLVSAEFEHVYFCLDALDELSDLRSLLELLRDSPSNMRYFLTGRPHIRNTVEKYMIESRSISIEAHRSDIVKFIEREIRGPNDAEPDAMNDDLRSKMYQSICESARGM